ncbi:MAG: MBL fold metallo-hydrolase, partial [Gemmatimonadaceae bacterium]
RWTTMDALRAGHRCAVKQLEPGLYGVGTEPRFGIGQRALLVRTPVGNVLWDCVPLLDDAIVDIVRALGGLVAIAVSHPHFYTSMVEWAHAFEVPVLLHAADRAWVMRPDPSITYWEGDTRALGDGLTLVRCGGHFEGSTVLHWAGGAEGRGALLTGDTIQLLADAGWVSFMRSYPNLVPLSAASVRAIAGAVRPFAFDRMYGGWWDLCVEHDAARVLDRSVERYVEAIGG